MPSLLIIEDGTNPTGANSYATAAEARTFASARGVVLSADDAVVEPMLINANDYLESLETKYKGARVIPTQPLAWPRIRVYLFNSQSPLAPNVIPGQLKQAQIQLVIEEAAGNILQPTGKGREVLIQKVDVIETTYAQTGSSTIRPTLNKALDLLSPLLIASGMTLRTLRV